MHKKNITLILGAGPAGMAAAFSLYKAGKQFILVEKENQVGGLAKTYQFGQFRTDNGPHRFFSKNQYLYDLIKDILGEQWILVNRFTRFYIDGKFYKYPIEWKDALLTMGLYKAIRVFVDYLIAKIKYYKKKPRNFEEYALKTFGQTLAKFNILNYTEKIWGLPCRNLSAEWAEQRIKDLTIWSLIKTAFFKSSKGPKTLVDQFYYPDLGTGLIYDTMKREIEKENPIFLQTEPTRITHADNRIQTVLLSNGKSYSPEFIISSIPITNFIELLDPLPPREILEANKKLRYRSQVYLFITVNKPSVMKDQWIYFPNPEIPFARISEMKNFSKKMSPADKTSLFIEFFCWEGDEVWNKSKENLFELTISHLEKLDFLKRDEVIDIYHIKQKNSYPVYDLNYKEHLRIVENYLNSFVNLIYIGRPGRFRYTNQDHSLEMGILAARSVIEGKSYDIENIGKEKEYFEKGYITNK